MFERFNEKARRVVFFARFEASQYGSAYIDTEHLLLGLCREDPDIRACLKDTEMDGAVRAEVERSIVRGQPFATSVEVPLSADGKNVLRFAAQEADRLGQRYVGTEHLLLGLLRVKDCLGARIVLGRGINAEEFREQLRKVGHPKSFRQPVLPTLEAFLEELKSQSASYLMSYLGKNAQIVDVHGRRWQCDEIAENFATLFAAYAKKNATYRIEGTVVDTDELLVAIVLWKNALVASMERAWMHRMTVVMVPQGEWRIVSMHISPVQP